MTRTSSEHIHVLVIDDDRALADTLVDWLRGLGYVANAAYGGQEGLKTFFQGDFSIVLLDFKMPDMDGMEVLAAIGGGRRKASVIMITGEGSIALAVEAMKKGAYDFLTKPCDFKVMEMILRRAAERQYFVWRLGLFRGISLALLISIPLWLGLGLLLARML